MSTKTERILPTLQELHDNGESDPEASLIFRALGAASVCWEKMEGTGVFNSDRAKRIGDELLFELGSRSLAHPPTSELVSAGNAMKECIGQIAYELEEGFPLTDEYSCITEAERSTAAWDQALSALRE